MQSSATLSVELGQDLSALLRPEKVKIGLGFRVSGSGD